MVFSLRQCIAIASLLILVSGGGEAVAQKPGGILRMYHFDSPAILSLHEEVTYPATETLAGFAGAVRMLSAQYRSDA